MRRATLKRCQPHRIAAENAIKSCVKSRLLHRMLLPEQSCYRPRSHPRWRGFFFSPLHLLNGGAIVCTESLAVTDSLHGSSCVMARLTSYQCERGFADGTGAGQSTIRRSKDLDLLSAETGTLGRGEAALAQGTV